MDNKKQEQLYDNQFVGAEVKGGSLVEFAKKRWNAMAYSKGREFFEWRTKNMIQVRDTFELGLSFLDSYKRQIRMPTFSNVVDDILDDVIDFMPETEYIAMDADSEENRRKAKLVTKARDDFAEKGDKRYEQMIAWDHAANYGLGPLFVGRCRIVDPEKKVQYDGMDYEAVDPRYVFFDENAKVLFDRKGKKGCRDLFRHHRMSLSTWHYNLAVNQDFYNREAVKAQSSFSGQHSVKSFRERNEDDDSRMMVDVLEYWNPTLQWSANGLVLRGVYAVFSMHNGKMVEHYIEQKKRIPCTIYYTKKRDDSIYGCALIEKLATIILALDEHLNIAFTEGRLATMPVTAIDAKSGFNKNKHKFGPGRFWKLTVPEGKKVADMFQIFQLPGVSQDFYQMRTLFDEELIKASKQDQRNLLRNPNLLAASIKQRVEAEKKKISAMVKMNTWKAEKELAELELQIMDEVLKYPVEDGNGKKKLRVINAKGYDVVKAGSVPELKPNNGSRIGQFKFTKNLLDTQMDVIVIDKKEKRANDTEQQGRMMQFLQIRTNALTLPPEAQKGLEPLINAIGETLGFTPDELKPDNDMTTSSPFEQQLELIFLGVKPEIDPNVSVADLLKQLEFYLEIIGKPVYTTLGVPQKKMIQEIIGDIDSAIRNKKPLIGAGGVPMPPPVPGAPAQGMPDLMSPTSIPGAPSLNPSLPAV